LQKEKEAMVANRGENKWMSGIGRSTSNINNKDIKCGEKGVSSSSDESNKVNQ